VATGSACGSKGAGHRITGSDLGQPHGPGARISEGADTTDRLDLTQPDVFLGYGGGLLLVRTSGAAVTGVTARGARIGIGLVDVRESYVADNDVSGNVAWGIHLWRSARNVVTRNRADHTVRCVPPADCRAAAILLREGSDSHAISENDLSASSTGLLLTGQAPLTRASVGNLVYRNDARARRVPVAAAFVWNVTLLENRADGGAGYPPIT
jgi:parallel beta-helix repeat protein